MMMVIIRRAIPQDAASLADFAFHAYAATFGEFTDPADLDDFLSETYGAAQQSVEIGNDDIRTLIAELEDKIIGYAQIRRSPTPDCVLGGAPVELWRFYIDKPWQGEGTAHKLMDAAKEAAIAFGGRTFWLGVWENNSRAIAFYTKHGFEIVGEKEFCVGKDCQRDRVMVADLI
jgi:ribosomal protein S18 acetylase RimI-like enzyme